MPQHVFRMIARRHRLLHTRVAARIEACEQDGRFHLSGGHIHPMLERKRIGSTTDGERQARPSPRLEGGTGLPKRLDDAAHRTPAQARIARHDGKDRVRGEDAGEQPGCSAGISHVENVIRLAQSAEPRTIHEPQARFALFHAGAECAHGSRRSEHVLALEQPVDPGTADRECCKHQRAMRDRLVAGNADGAGERRCGSCCERAGLGGHAGRVARSCAVVRRAVFSNSGRRVGVR